MTVVHKMCLAILVASLSANYSFASGQCPAGLKFVGQAYKEDSKVNAEAKVPAVEVLVKLPPGLKVNKNYRQSGGKWAGGSASATMTDGNVPNGFAIIASGTEGGEKGWSVGAPDVVVIDEDGDTILQRGVKIRLYCHTGSGEVTKLGHVSCNVKADICVLEKR
ncbi:hypothetical protein ACK83U_12365 [Rhizobium sp. WW22]|uniref:hypothetical protein n=1 Tax=Rhizobium sp. WW22 TaxID=3389070 RepID=UPI000DD6E072